MTSHFRPHRSFLQSLLRELATLCIYVPIRPLRVWAHWWFVNQSDNLVVKLNHLNAILDLEPDNQQAQRAWELARTEYLKGHGWYDMI